jgi:uncharacterized protein (UPF0333 family)
MNKRGQVVIYALMVAIVIIVLIMALAPAIKNSSDDSRAATTDTAVGLDCSNSSISTWDSATCLFTDLLNPYFVICVLGLIGAIITARVVFE